MRNYQYRGPETFPPIVKNLIIINVLVFVAQKVFDQQYDLTNKIMLWPVQSEEFRPYQIATHMFAHGDIAHIFFNMFALWLFGRVLEGVWHQKRFLFFYLACGVGAAALHILVQYLQYERLATDIRAIADVSDIEAEFYLKAQIHPVLGASGAVMGVAVAFAYLFPNTELTVPPIWIPIKAKWLVLLYVAGDLISGFSNRAGDNIAHFAHLGGALTGFIIVLIWNKTNRRTFY